MWCRSDADRIQEKLFSQDRGLAAVAMVKDVIAPALIGKDPREQSGVDDLILSSVGSVGSVRVPNLAKKETGILIIIVI